MNNLSKIFGVLFIILPFVALSQYHYFGSVKNDLTNNSLEYHPVFFLDSTGKKHITFTNQYGKFHFYSPYEISLIYSFGFYNNRIYYFMAQETKQDHSSYLIEVKHNNKLYPDTFRLSGEVFNLYNSEPLTNYPLNFYYDTTDFSQKITIYTDNTGHYKLTLTLPPDTAFYGILEIKTYCNGWQFTRDTLKIYASDQNIDFQICHNPYYGENKIYITGYVLDSSTLEGIENHPVLLANLNSMSFNNINTTKNGFFSDSLIIDTNTNTEIIVSTYSFYKSKVIYYSDTLQINPEQIVYNIIFKIQQETQDTQFLDFRYFINENNEVLFLPVSNSSDKFRWDFGDGEQQTGNIVTHYYKKKGIYFVKLSSLNTDLTIVKPVLIGNEFYSIRGYVKTSNSFLPKGKVSIFHIDENQRYKYYTTVAVNNGFYNIKKVYPGENLLVVIPDFDVDTLFFPKYLPTYYENSITWKQADILKISNDTTFDINLICNPDPFYGHNTISGNIEEDKMSVFQNYFIVLYDENFRPLDFRKIENGKFKFQYLPQGIYYLFLEYPGKQQEYLKIVLSNQEGENLKVKYFITDNSVYGVTAVSQKNNNLKVYPNPTHYYIYIYIYGFAEKGDLQIFNSQGIKVLQTQYKPNQPIDVSNLQTGIYTVLFKSNTVYFRQTIIKY